MVVIDSCVRTIPGALGNSESLTYESFSNGFTNSSGTNRMDRMTDFNSDERLEIEESSKLKTVPVEGYNISNSSDGDLRKLLEYPHYTKPRMWRGLSVPEILTSGDHGKIEEWRYQRALEITKRVRPDLLKAKL